MAKQIKIGFDKIPVPATNTYEQLYDINSGVVLRDSEGRPLYTEEISPIATYSNSSRALSSSINNSSRNPLPIEEVFAESSQVSASLLGVIRAETQLGLFSDVSVYGRDENIWEYFRYIQTGYNEPEEWRTRRNNVYGDRFESRLEEISNEQALALTAYPVPWSFPYGPRFADIGAYNNTGFERYQRFIKFGNDLYDFYLARDTGNGAFKKFAEDNFLNRIYVSLAGDDVFYNTEEYRTELVFEKIETWTISWMKIRDGELFDPNNDKVTFFEELDATNNVPGGSAQRIFYSQLESRRVFRYQPGRISGFTFGIRASTDPGSLNNIIEWGCCNETDEYVFQIKGSQFSIVRRSAIPLPKENIERMGLAEEDQVLKPVINPLRRPSTLNPTNTSNEVDDELYELVIPRDKFNGDSLDGNGPSGYIISFEQVTMYKIEFSWYGAIGARFYAYIPSGNSEARWVLIHSIIIENQLGQPCLKDPFFKFRYTLAINETSNLRTPQYIYKYGASYYIDGGDEGTTTIHNYSSNLVETSISNSRSVLGIKAKDVILNSIGQATKNRKDVIPQKMFVTSTTPARIDIIECEGCPGGFGYFYAPSLRKGTVGITGTLTIESTGTNAGRKIVFEPDDENLTEADWLPEEGTLTKIISPGLYSSYFNNERTIFRRVANSIINNQPISIEGFSNISEVRLLDGTLVNPKEYQFINTRLSKYSLTAATTELTKKNIYVNFLNPRALDNGYFAEFFIGITNKVPTLGVFGSENEGKLLLDDQAPVLKDLFFAEVAQYAPTKNREGFDVGEGDGRYGDEFEIDPIIPNPPGFDSGRCTRAKIEISNIPITGVEYSTNPVPGVFGNYLIFDLAIINSLNKIQGGEIAIPDVNNLGQYIGTGAFIVASQATPFISTGGLTRYYLEITDIVDTSGNEIAIRFLTMSGRYINITRAVSWNIYPLYVIMGLRDGARVNNITFTEEDELGTFTHTPSWLIETDGPITVVSSGNLTERTNPSSGLFEAGGLSVQGAPSANFKENYRLDSAQIDTQLQQPLRPGEVRSSVFVEENSTEEIDLKHVFGQDRYVITPGLTNTRATFITAKSLQGGGEVQISIVNKEQ